LCNRRASYANYNCCQNQLFADLHIIPPILRDYFISTKNIGLIYFLLFYRFVSLSDAALFKYSITKRMSYL